MKLNLKKPARFKGDLRPVTIIGKFLNPSGVPIVVYFYRVEGEHLPRVEESGEDWVDKVIENIPEEHWVSLSKNSGALLCMKTYPSEELLRSAMLLKELHSSEYHIAKLEMK